MQLWKDDVHNRRYAYLRGSTIMESLVRPHEADEPYALSPKDAAKRLGIDVSTLYRHYANAIRSGKIRTLRIGRAVRIIWRSLLDYIEAETHHKDRHDDRT